MKTEKIFSYLDLLLLIALLWSDYSNGSSASSSTGQQSASSSRATASASTSRNSPSLLSILEDTPPPLHAVERNTYSRAARIARRSSQSHSSAAAALPTTTPVIGTQAHSSAPSYAADSESYVSTSQISSSLESAAHSASSSQITAQAEASSAPKSTAHSSAAAALPTTTPAVETIAYSCAPAANSEPHESTLPISSSLARTQPLHSASARSGKPPLPSARHSAQGSSTSLPSVRPWYDEIITFDIEAALQQPNARWDAERQLIVFNFDEDEEGIQDEAKAEERKKW